METRKLDVEESHAEHHDCWNQIGVSGDGTCPELEKVIHCRNCPVYVANGRRLLERAPPEAYLREWTQQLAEEKDTDQDEAALSVLIFRLAQEWLAIPTHICQEVAEMRPIHTLPHRSGPVLLGLVNIRGEIRLCVSINPLLGLELAAPSTQAANAEDPQCLLVIAREEAYWVLLVDELHGIQHFQLNAFREAPVTVTKSTPALTTGVIDWQDRRVGYLDDEQLFAALAKEIV